MTYGPSLNRKSHKFFENMYEMTAHVWLHSSCCIVPTRIVVPLAVSLRNCGCAGLEFVSGFEFYVYNVVCKGYFAKFKHEPAK